jgi:hypothetical protein
MPAEEAALKRRYSAAITDCSNRQCSEVAGCFEQSMQTTNAVFCCSLAKLFPMATGDRDIYATYYDLLPNRLFIPPEPTGSNWNVRRQVCEDAIFGTGVREHVHYAALSLGERGLHNYGECLVILREQMISHRATIFEENSIVFLKRHNVAMFDADKLPPGYRSTWENRAVLCVSKLAHRLQPDTDPTEFAGLLLHVGETRQDDDFVEVHIFGPMTFRTFAKIIVTLSHQRPDTLQAATSPDDVRIQALSEILAKAGSSIEVS